MRISLIRKANERIPYWIKRPFSKIIRGKLIKNSDFLACYQMLEMAEGMSQEEKVAWQLEKTKEVLEHAYRHTAYYRILFDKAGFRVGEFKELDDLQKIPLLTKQVLLEKLEEIVADDCPDFYLVTTGGTTGKPTKVFMERTAIYREWAFVYHYWSKYGYDYKKSRIVTFRGVDCGKKLYKYNPLYNEVRMNPFLMNRLNLKTYVKVIESFGAEFIYGYPSAVYNFCRLLKEEGILLQKRFKGALLISENLYSFQEEMITKVLGCRIAMFYGHSERAVFAEKSHNGYRFHPFYGVTELMSNGALAVTGFINGKTPLIRYVVDDKAKSIDGEKYCIVGHWNSDVLYGLNGEQVSMAAVNFHDDTLKEISGYQFVQNKIGECVIRVVSDKEMDRGKIELLEKRIQRKLGKGFSCTAEQVDALELSARGKYRMLIQNWNSGG